MCGQHNVRVTARDNTDKGHTSQSKREIKIPHPMRNQTQGGSMGGSPGGVGEAKEGLENEL